MSSKVAVTFIIDCGPSKVFDKLDRDHEWTRLKVGSVVDIYHTAEKWEGTYKVTKREDFSPINISYRLQLTHVHIKCTTPGHFKEWMADIKDNYDVVCHWGKIGQSNQTKTFRHNSMSQALQYVNEKMEEKLKKGYTKA